MGFTLLIITSRSKPPIYRLRYILHNPLSHDFEPTVPNAAERRQPKRTSDDNPEAIRVSKGTRKRLNGIQTCLPYGRHPNWRHEKRSTKITSRILAVFPLLFLLLELDLHWKTIGESLCPHFRSFYRWMGLDSWLILLPNVTFLSVLQNRTKEREKRTLRFYNTYEKKTDQH